MAKGSTPRSAQSPKRKNSKSSRANRNQPTLNGSDTVCIYEPCHYTNVEINKLQSFNNNHCCYQSV